MDFKPLILHLFLSSFIPVGALLCLTTPAAAIADPERIRVGVQTTLTGDAATFGTDIRHALEFANATWMQNRYEFIFEDDKCTARGGVDVATKFASITKVKYVLGPACNEALIPAAAIYERSGITVLSAVATTGDILDVGKHIFRMFPSDGSSAEVLYHYIAARHRRLALYSEENQYPVMVASTFSRLSALTARPLEIIEENWAVGTYEHRTALAKLIGSKPDAFFINANVEASYGMVLRQLRALKYAGQIYASYWPASEDAMQTLGKANDGVVFVNTPQIETSLTSMGREAYASYVKQYGKPLSISLGIAVTMDSLRLLDLAIRSNRPVSEFLHTINFEGLVGKISFDTNGAIQGIPFQIQQIVNGNVVVVQR